MINHYQFFPQEKFIMDLKILIIQDDRDFKDKFCLESFQDYCRDCYFLISIYFLRSDLWIYQQLQDSVDLCSFWRSNLQIIKVVNWGWWVLESSENDKNVIELKLVKILYPKKLIIEWIDRPLVLNEIFCKGNCE